MTPKATLLVLLLTSSTALSSGWHDYELDIGDGYRVFRANSLEVCLSNDRKMLIHPLSYDEEVGPIIGYCIPDTCVFTKNLGRTGRTLRDGQTWWETDCTRAFYFIVSKSNDSVLGPLSEAQFEEHPSVASVKPVKWSAPRNPNVLTPLLGDLLFLAFGVWFMVVRYWFVVPAFIVVVLILFVRISRKVRCGAKSGSS